MHKYNEVTLFTPGPVSVASRVLLAASRPMIHHRTPEFHSILKSVIERIKLLFGTSEDVLLVHTSGRGAMEAAIRNLFSPGDKLLCVCNGKFGHMFSEIAEVCGLQVRRIFEEWFSQVNLAQIDEILANDPDIKGITVVHSDTSTAVINPIAEIGNLARRHDRLLVVDCVSSLGAMEFNCDGWNVDVAVTASQKGLMAATGLSFVAINDRAWRANARATSPGYYVNFKTIKENYEKKSETPGSTPVSLVVSVNESLNMIFEEGLENVFKRHALISRSIKASLEALGLPLLPEGDIERSDCVTLLKSPDGVDPSLIKEMAREKYGVLIASGLGDLKDNALRIGHMGTITVREALLLVSVLEMILFELGRVDKPGKGLEAFYSEIKGH